LTPSTIDAARSILSVPIDDGVVEHRAVALEDTVERVEERGGLLGVPALQGRHVDPLLRGLGRVADISPGRLIMPELNPRRVDSISKTVH